MRITRFLGAGHDFPHDRHDTFASQGMRNLVNRCITLGVKHHLRQPSAIAQIDEQYRAVIPTTLYPAIQDHLLPDLRLAQFAAPMGPDLHALLRVEYRDCLAGPRFPERTPGDPLRRFCDGFWPDPVRRTAWPGPDLGDFGSGRRCLNLAPGSVRSSFFSASPGLDALPRSSPGRSPPVSGRTNPVPFPGRRNFAP